MNGLQISSSEPLQSIIPFDDISMSPGGMSFLQLCDRPFVHHQRSKRRSPKLFGRCPLHRALQEPSTRFVYSVLRKSGRSLLIIVSYERIMNQKKKPEALIERCFGGLYSL
jgi:hypothetical protein